MCHACNMVYVELVGDCMSMQPIKSTYDGGLSFSFHGVMMLLAGHHACMYTAPCVRTHGIHALSREPEHTAVCGEHMQK
jgi:hypothetical protein